MVFETIFRFMHGDVDRNVPKIVIFSCYTTIGYWGVAANRWLHIWQILSAFATGVHRHDVSMYIFREHICEREAGN